MPSCLRACSNSRCLRQRRRRRSRQPRKRRRRSGSFRLSRRTTPSPPMPRAVALVAKGVTSIEALAALSVADIRAHTGMKLMAAKNVEEASAVTAFDGN